MSAELSSHEANSRFKYLEPPFPLPGKCAVCGNVKRPVVDFGANIDPYGAVLICTACVAEAHALLVRHDVVRVPQAPSAEELRAVHEQIKEEFDVRMGSFSDLLDRYDGLLRSSADAVAQASVGDSDETTGVADEGSKLPDEPSDNSAGNKGPARVSSSSVKRTNTTAGL